MLARDPVLLIPVGATEQHGPALPVAVDSILVECVALEAAERASSEQAVLVAPTLPYGCSHYHLRFPGTMSLPTRVFIDAVAALSESLLGQGFRRVLVLNGHGGNHAPLAVAARDVHERSGATIGVASYWSFAAESLAELRESPLGGISHACEMETSLMYIASPGSVRDDRRLRFIPKGSNWHAADLLDADTVSVVEDVRAVTPTGVLGDATAATPEKGRRMLDAIVGELARFLIDFPATVYGSEGGATT